MIRNYCSLYWSCLNFLIVVHFRRFSSQSYWKILYSTLCQEASYGCQRFWILTSRHMFLWYLSRTLFRGLMSHNLGKVAQWIGVFHMYLCYPNSLPGSSIENATKFETDSDNLYYFFHLTHDFQQRFIWLGDCFQTAINLRFSENLVGEGGAIC